MFAWYGVRPVSRIHVIVQTSHDRTLRPVTCHGCKEVYDAMKLSEADLPDVLWEAARFTS